MLGGKKAWRPDGRVGSFQSHTAEEKTRFQLQLSVRRLRPVWKNKEGGKREANNVTLGFASNAGRVPVSRATRK